MRWFHHQKDPVNFSSNGLCDEWADENKMVRWVMKPFLARVLNVQCFLYPLKNGRCQIWRTFFKRGVETTTNIPTYIWFSLKSNRRQFWRLYWTKWKALLNFWRWFWMLFQMAYWIDTTFLISSRPALYPEAQLLVDDLLLHRRQGGSWASSIRQAPLSWNMILVFNTVAVSRDTQTSKRN